MRRSSLIFLAIIVGLIFSAQMANSDYSYKANKEHLGGNVTPVEAYDMFKKDPKHIYIVDCRTRAEYQYVGHPVGAYNIPIRFLTTKIGKKGYVEETNSNFGKDLLTRFNPDTDTLIILCRSGNRSCTACNEAIKAGFAEDRVFNMMGGFEGGKNKNKDSLYYGKRWAGGWKLEGLPWTYSMDKNLMYKLDVDKMVASD
jgi:rhodanese-related sulfurtransferase